MIDEERLADIDKMFNEVPRRSSFAPVFVYALVSEIRRLRNSIRLALQPLGTGKCLCDGCEHETFHAVEILKRALDAR